MGNKLYIFTAQFLFLFAIFILHSRESDVLLCLGRYVRTRLGVAISGSPVFDIKVGASR